MIEVRELIETILYDLNETYSRKHSDVELISHINVILRHLNVALANHDSSFVTKEVMLKPKNGIAKLPKDFMKIVGLEGGESDYKILGDNIHVKFPINMDYIYSIPKVETIDDVINLPYFMFDLIVKLTEGNIHGAFDRSGLIELMGKEVNDILSTGEPITRPLPFYV